MSGGVTLGTRDPVSFWHRLRHTPLRDVLRGRLSGPGYHSSLVTGGVTK